MTSPQLIVLIAACESAGVGLLGATVLHLLRRQPLGLSLIAVVVITVCATNISVITAMFVTESDSMPVTVSLAVNCVAGVVSVGVSLVLGRSVMTGGRRLADATRAFGREQRFSAPTDLPSAEFAELARELRVTSENLAESQRRERALDASRRRVVSWISHDLRAPLHRMRLKAEAVEDGVSPDLPRYFREVRADVDQLTEMAQDLFELSKLQSGTLRLKPVRVPLDDLLSDVVARTDVLTEKRDVRLRAERIDPVVATVDYDAMSRVFTNLLVNSAQYGPVGGAVSLELRADGEHAVVSVSDECGGIPAADLDSVFDTGWRGGDRDTAPQGGGLGLAIVQGMVEAHHGRVRVFNVVGGCCFEVRIPLATA
ncbi:HAMP domain-containing sensor histidine kinase [Saccharopolyspora gloriosae]|uniref:histidine kinase n=1 Tax=Saccharopolyspora gloriosae TaxID=455344 RepID=A0A840NJ68_9PSEU|nr:HAMP domain-containing sensor histidine kinase [Saccharopolyspora gloriosae]MBB5070348.1 signal transduction histidine kinase [Saccharopolyspora gloriosae]